MPPAAPDHEKKVDQLLLSHYSPPAVVIDADLRVLQFRGDTSTYLRHAPGSASLNLSKLARGNLSAEIRKLLQSKEAKAGRVKSRPIDLLIDGSEKKLAVSILPVQDMPEPQFLVVFEEEAPKPERRASKGLAEVRGGAAAERIKELEEELNSTKRYLQSVIEEQEAATEELKSAHEEVQSSNEELQSTNEELLTAKEELQSTNEELTTVNDEMQSRNAELQQMNSDLINLLSSVNIPIVMLGNDQRIRRFTPQAEKILNLLPSDVNRPISDFRLKINVPDLVELCQEVIDTLVPREREVQDTEGRLYSMWVRPYRTADNRIDGVVLALLDVTERKQASEARYRRLFEASKDGIVVADGSTGEIVDTNPFVTNLFGYSRAQLMGVKFWESALFHDSEIDESIHTALETHDSIQKNLRLTSASGEAVPVELVANTYSEGSKKVIQFNIRDVSARKRMEEQLHRGEEQRRVAQKMEAVGRLAGGVAHDFNNILTAVLGYIELLQEHVEKDQTAVQMLNEIRNGAGRAVALTRQLLAFGRKQILSPTVLEVNTVVTDLRQMMGVMIPNGIEMDMQLQSKAGRVHVDRTQLEQVILNLVLNARDAMQEGGTLTIETANVDADQAFSERHPTVPAGKYVAITVRDTGTGMDQNTQAHMFEPFFTTKSKGSGVGLGLSTVYNIVKQSDGHIWAYSELGIGTTFTVYLPRVEEEIQQAAAASEQAGADGKGTETLLVVDDENSVRELARRFLERSGYTVLVAANGPEALNISRDYKAPIHLMITDVVMPRMSGRELALQLASERPEMQVLYTSGHTEDAIVHHGVLREGMEFLQKPFSREELVSRARRILDNTGQPSRPAGADASASGTQDRTNET